MSSSKSRRPIGVFDSGLGGLTVVKQMRRKFPHEDIVYIGDLAHLPYGNKSPRQIHERALACSKFLLKQKSKAIVIACNSASAYAYSYVKKNVNVPVLNVIDAAVSNALEATKNHKIGVIATQATIQSLTYEKRLLRSKDIISFFLRACPLFVPLVEEGEVKGKIASGIVKQYLKPMKTKKVDTLILGCTHYPLLKNTIQKEMGSQVSLVDSAVPTVDRLSKILQSDELLNASAKKGKLKVFVTDYGQNFLRIGSRFLSEPIHSFKLVRV